MIHLLLGPEEGQKRDFINLNILNPIKKKDSNFKHYKYHGFDLSSQNLESALFETSLFGDLELIEISQIDELKKSELEVIIKFIGNPDTNKTLILLSLKNSVDKSLESIINKDHKKVFWEMFEQNKITWVEDYFKKNNCQVSTDAIHFLLDNIQNDTLSLKKEIDKIIQFKGSNSLITDDLLEKYLYHSKEESVYTLFDKMILKDFESSVEISKKLFFMDNSGRFIGLLTTLFRSIRDFKSFTDNNIPYTGAFATLKINSKIQQKKFQNASRIFSKKTLNRAVFHLFQCEIDFRINSNPALRLIIFEMALYKILIKDGADMSEIKDENIFYNQNF